MRHVRHVSYDESAEISHFSHDARASYIGPSPQQICTALRLAETAVTALPEGYFESA
jgi:hypothetical protein